MVVPGEAGGGGDVLARQLAKASSGVLDSHIVVLNKPGAGGQTALQYCSGQKKDGGCIVHVSRSVISLNPYVSKSKYHYSDFAGVFRIQIDPTYVAVSSNSPYKTIGDLIDAAKSRTDKIKIVSGAVGSVEYVLVNELEKAAGSKFSYVPYEGGATVGLDLAGGHSEVGIVNASDNIELIKSNKIRLLAVARPDRTKMFPNVPTLAESGYDVGDLDQWRGFVVPKGVSADVVRQLDVAFKKATDSAEFQKYQEASGLLPGYLDHSAFDTLMAKQSGEAEALFKKLGISQ